jgi:hypothetical protein
MSTLKSKSEAVKAIGDGHLRRQLKQMALRGCGRNFSDDGICGKQKLVFAGEFSRLYGLFPGAALPAYGHAKDNTDNTATLARKLVAIFSRQGAEVITTKAISEELCVSWRECSSRLLASSDVQQAIDAFRWRYVPVRGRGGGRFVREAVAANRLMDLSAPLGNAAEVQVYL